jgi:hypothetical protein
MLVFDKYFKFHYLLSIHVFSHLFSMMTLRSGVADIDVEQRHCGDDTDVDVTVKDVEYRRSASVDKNVADPKVSTSRQQDQHLIDTDKFECCH